MGLSLLIRRCDKVHRIRGYWLSEGGKTVQARRTKRCLKLYLEKWNMRFIIPPLTLAINLHHVMDFSSVPAFEAVMLNTGAVVHSYGEYLEEAIKIEER